MRITLIPSSLLFCFAVGSVEHAKLYMIVVVVSDRQWINSEVGSMSKKRAAEFSVSDLRER